MNWNLLCENEADKRYQSNTFSQHMHSIFCVTHCSMHFTDINSFTHNPTKAFYYPHFQDKSIEAQEGELIFLIDRFLPDPHSSPLPRYCLFVLRFGLGEFL